MSKAAKYEKFDKAVFTWFMWWEDRWKAQNNDKFKTVSGEKNHAYQEWLHPARKVICQPLLSRYKLEDIFTADEFSLFFQSTTKQNSGIERRKYSDGKHSNVRLTWMWTMSATGEKLLLLLIGKSKNLR